MARIHPEILKKLGATLDVKQARVYELVAAKAGETHLPRHLAALVLAAQHGININKRAYATDDERVQMRSITVAGVTAAPPTRAEFAPTKIPKATKRQKGTRSPARKSNSVFVVHGRNARARDAMFEFLRSIGLQPIEWTQAVKATRKGAPHNMEVVVAAFQRAAAVVVLLTPDDEARLKPEYRTSSDPAYERELTGQARPNVIFEAGRAFGSHPEATIIVELGNTRPFSDTAGVNAVRISNDPGKRRDLANRLETAGCEVDISGEDWLRAGDFTV